MLRYIFLKLSGFTSKKDFSISSSCNQMLMIRHLTRKVTGRTTGREQLPSRLPHKRSYSFPSRDTKSRKFLEHDDSFRRWSKTDIEGPGVIRTESLHQGLNEIQKDAGPSSLNRSCEYSTSLKKAPVKNNYHEANYIDEEDRYELEAARPRKSQSELVFNVFDYVARDVDLTDYLQPSNLKPFGSNENMYLPVLTSQKNLCLDPQAGPVSLDNESITEQCLEHVRELDNVKPPESHNAPKKEAECRKPYKELIRKHRSLTPTKVRAVSSANRAPPPRSVTLDSAEVEEPASAEALHAPIRQKFSLSKSSVTIDPPPFLPKNDDVFSSISFGNMNRGMTRDVTNFTRVHPPWPAYSDHVKHLAKKTLAECPSMPVVKTDNFADTPKSVEDSHSADYLLGEGKPKSPMKPEPIRNTIPQRRTLSMEHVKSVPPVVQERPQSTSSKWTDCSKKRTLLSVCRKGVSFCPSHSYGKSCKYRKFEPGSCAPPKPKRKCFLPSKVRLAPPKCITLPPVCPKPHCPPRADECLEPRKKKLPCLKDSPCECFEPVIPDKNPKLKRLPIHFEEIPRTCPCEPQECPCEPPVRADQCTPPKEKKLRPYKPGKCECVERSPMVDVPLVRLTKCPILECPKEPCVKEVCGDDVVRADDCMKPSPKVLPQLVPKPCPCIDQKLADAPKLKRLNLRVEDPPRKICPKPVCPPTECFRVDACQPVKVKKLQPIKPRDCPCIEQKMLDVKPLRRLKCVEEPCICMPCDPCTENPRADLGCWEYLQDVKNEPADKGDSKNQKDSKFKQKRRYNTDATTRVANCADGNNLKTTSALDTKSAKHGNEVEKCNEAPNKSKLHVNRSLSTLYLLRKLDKSKTNHDDNYPTPHSPPPARKGSVVNAYIRQLSTAVSKANVESVPFSSSSKNSFNDSKDSKDSKTPTSKSGKCTKPCKKDEKCPKLAKCPPLTTGNCPPRKASISCIRQRVPVCCEKKIVPNPSFSECMDEEIAPFSNTSQWKCDRKEYGFDPNPKKTYEPLDTIKDKKKFCTLSTHCINYMEKGENPIVSYFAARYFKPVPKSKETVDQHMETESKSVECNDGFECKVSSLNENKRGDCKRRGVKKELSQAEDQSPRLLSHNSTSTVISASNRKMSTHDTGFATLRSNSSAFLRPPLNFSQSSLRKNLSTITTRCMIDSAWDKSPPWARPLCDKKCCREKYDEGKRPRPECRKKCPKFQMANCPEKERTECRRLPPNKICNKLNAPYPSFSELMDNDMEDKLSECPVDRAKVQLLQPRYTLTLQDTNSTMFRQVGPQQGRVDPKLEEKCIREKLCLQNEGLSQDCTNFGDYIRPLKARNFFKDRNTDCETIEELRKLGKWPPKYKKSSNESAPDAGGQKRKMCSSMHALKSPDEKMENTQHARNFHVLYSNPIDRTHRNNQPADTDGRCKYPKPRNVQWRIRNLQKWHGLRKTSNFTYFSKRYHTCSKLQFRSFVKPTRHSYVANAGGQILPWGVIPFKWKNLNVSTVKTPVDNPDALLQRGISTTMSLTKNRTEKCIRYPIHLKKVQKKHSKITTEMGSLIQKPTWIPARTKKKYTKTSRKKRKVACLQPKYPSVPEIDTVPRPTTYPTRDCLERKGQTYDCSALEKPFIHLHRNSNGGPSTGVCKPCGETFLRENKRTPPVPPIPPAPPTPPRCSPCPKIQIPDKCLPKPDNRVCGLDNSVPKPENSVLVAKEGRRLNPCAQQVCPPHPRSSVPPQSRRPEKAPLLPPALLSLWRQIVQYFRAKPNCPPPHAWKQKVLRERAEKAAKAAGLCLCDPKDLPRNVSNKPDGQQGQSANNNANGCFPACRLNPCKTTTRHYSSGVKWKSPEDKRKLLEGQNKRCEDDSNREEDAALKCLDPALESIFKAAILDRNSMNYLDRSASEEASDSCLCHAVNVLPSDLNVLDDCLKDDLNRFNHSKPISDFPEYVIKTDNFSEITYEEMEKVKTNTLVKELDKLLEKSQNSQKKN